MKKQKPTLNIIREREMFGQFLYKLEPNLNNFTQKQEI